MQPIAYFRAPELGGGALPPIFRDAIAKAATDAVEAIENWPWPDAVPLAGSMQRIDAIDAELLDVRVRASTLREQATELGIDVELPALPEPEPEPIIRDYVPTRANAFGEMVTPFAAPARTLTPFAERMRDNDEQNRRHQSRLQYHCTHPSQSPPPSNT
jgi:hypothetical protein